VGEDVSKRPSKVEYKPYASLQAFVASEIVALGIGGQCRSVVIM